MAKKNSIKVNIDDMFLSGTMDDPIKRKEVMNSPMWPIAVAIYSLTGGRVRVSEATRSFTDDFGEEDHALALSTVHGFTVASISHDPRDAEGRTEDGLQRTAFSIQAAPTLFCTNAFDLADGMVLHTNSQRYAVNKLSKHGHDVSNAILDLINRMDVTTGDMIRSILDRTVDREYGGSLSSRPSINIPEHLSPAMLKTFMGVMDKHQVPADIVARIEDVYSKFKERDDRFNNAIETTKQMFDGEKIIFFPRVRHGVVIGKTRMLPAQAALDEYSSGNHLPFTNQFNYLPEAEFTLPMRWYKSVEHIPAELRKELEIQLVMLKVHTNANSLLPAWDTYQNGSLWPQIGMASVMGSGTRSEMLMLNAVSAA